MKTHVADTSVESLQRISNSQDFKSLGDLIVVIVRNAQRAGAQNMSMREIKQALLADWSRDVDMSTISPQVNRMVVCGRLLRDKDHPRVCTVSGVPISPLSVPVVQTRLVA